MKLNSRSCVLDAFAFILESPPKHLAELIGHYGPEGYHTQELIDVAVGYGYAVTAFERWPQSTDWETGMVRDIGFKGGREERFIKHLQRAEGVLLGSAGLNPHAVALSAGDIYDSSDGISYPLMKDGKIDERMFQPEVFLRIERCV